MDIRLSTVMRVLVSFVQVVLFARGRTRYLDRDPPTGLGSLDTQVDDGPLLGQPLPSSVLSVTEPAEQAPRGRLPALSGCPASAL